MVRLAQITADAPFVMGFDNVKLTLWYATEFGSGLGNNYPFLVRHYKAWQFVYLLFLLRHSASLTIILPFEAIKQRCIRKLKRYKY